MLICWSWFLWETKEKSSFSRKLFEFFNFLWYMSRLLCSNASQASQLLSLGNFFLQFSPILTSKRPRSEKNCNFTLKKYFSWFQFVVFCCANIFDISFYDENMFRRSQNSKICDFAWARGLIDRRETLNRFMGELEVRSTADRRLRRWCALAKIYLLFTLKNWKKMSTNNRHHAIWSK